MVWRISNALRRVVPASQPYPKRWHNGRRPPGNNLSRPQGGWAYSRGLFLEPLEERTLLAVGGINGSVFDDLDADGVWDGGEPGLEGVTVFLDSNDNGQLDGGESSTLTDINGDYSFTDLAPDTYTVAEVVQTGWEQTLPGASWDLLQTFDWYAGTPGSLGCTVAALGDDVLIGAYLSYWDDPVNSGVVHLFDGSTGNLLRTFDNPTPAAGDEFGTSVAAVGNNVLVGAPYDDTGDTDTGSAYLLDSTNGNTLLTFNNPTPGYLDNFGYSVAAVGNNVLIGAPFDDAGAAVGSGTAYLFDGTTGNLLLTFNNPTPADFDNFGWSVAAVGNNVLIGAPYDDDTGVSDAGAAYLFDGSTGALLQTFQKSAPQVFEQFGHSVAAVGENVLVGALCDKTGAEATGAAYLFDSSGNLLTSFLNPTPAQNDQFAYSVAAVGENVLISARYDTVTATEEGIAYLFDASTGEVLHTFENPTPADYEWFGHGVAAVGNNVLVGALYDGTGAAYLFAGGASTHPVTVASGQTVEDIDFGNAFTPIFEIIDNGDIGFTTSGDWYPYSGLGFEGDLHYSFVGDGSDTASWSFTVTPGQYEVAATWTAHTNRATNAPYEVFNGATSLGTVPVNQQAAPDDFSDQGAAWETIGTYTIMGDTLLVELSDSANGLLIADAVRIEWVGDVPTAQIIDDGDTGFGTTGDWYPYSGLGFEDDLHYSFVGDGSDTASWSFTVTPGQYEVAATWTAHTNRATNAPYEVFNGATSLGTVPVNQQAAPDDFSDQGAAWETIGTYTIMGDTLLVKLSDSANGLLIADAVRVERVGDVPAAQTIDDGDTGFTASGDWYPYSGLGFEGDLHYSFVGDGSDVASWTFTVTPGQYEVAATWAEYPNRATNAPYEVFNGATSLETVPVNQQAAPDDFSDQGAAWETLGTYTITGDTLVVKLSDAANGLLIADAVRVERVGEPPTNDPPVAVDDDAYTTDENTILSVPAPGVLGNDSDLNGDDLTVVAVDDSGIPAGQLDWNPDGSFTYDPNGELDWLNEGESVQGTASYTVSDGHGGTDTATVTVTISGVNDPPANDPPVAVDDNAYTTDENTILIVPAPGVLGNDSDLNGDDLTVIAVDDSGLPAGQLDWNPDGSFTYDPNELDWLAEGESVQGTASYTVSDGHGGTDTATVTVTISGVDDPPPQIIDNGDMGFTASGDWYYYSSLGFEDDLHYSFVGTGSDVASWSFAVAPGQYQVAAAWSAHSNRATNAPYTICNGATSLQTVPVNQQVAPDDFSDQGTVWETLGTYTITGGALLVTLSDSANGLLIADAIRVERVGNVPTTQTVDNGDAGFITSGDWYPYSGLGFENDLHYSFVGDGSDVASWSFAVTPGEYEVAATWATHANRATNAPYEVYDGAMSLETVPVDQQAAPDDFTDQGAVWETLGTYTIMGNTLRVKLSDNANGLLIADAVRIERVRDLPLIIDNGDTGFSAIGDWVPYSSLGFEGDLQYNAAGAGSDTASWSFTVAPGTYQVAATWAPHSNRASDAPYTVYDGATAFESVLVNQKVAPDDFDDQGVAWEVLGTVEITGASLVVELSDNANGLLIADAVRIERVGDGPWLDQIPDQQMLTNQDTLVLTVSALSRNPDDLTIFPFVTPSAPVTLSMVGDQLTIDPADGFVGDFVVRVVANDGVNTDKQDVSISVTENAHLALSTMMAAPGEMLYVTYGGGFAPVDGLVVRFFNNDVTLDIPLMMANGTAVGVPVPMLLDPATGEFCAGNVDVVVVEKVGEVETFVTDVIEDFFVLDLPPAPDPAGSVTAGHLQYMIDTANRYLGNISGTDMDTPDLNNALNSIVADYAQVLADVQSVVDNPIVTFDTGLFDGQPVTVGADALREVDRAILAMTNRLSGNWIYPQASVTGLRDSVSTIETSLAGGPLEHHPQYNNLAGYMDSLGDGTTPARQVPTGKAVDTGLTYINAVGAAAGILAVAVFGSAAAVPVAVAGTGLIIANIVLGGGLTAIGGELTSYGYPEARELVQTGAKWLDKGMNSVLSAVTSAPDKIKAAIDVLENDTLKNYNFQPMKKLSELLAVAASPTFTLPPITLSIDDTSVPEGAPTETDTAKFLVTLSRLTSQEVTFQYSTSDGSATQGDDYGGVAGFPGTIAAGSLGTFVQIDVYGDSDPEINDTFFTTLSNESANVTLGRYTGMATIVNDDDPTISIGNAQVSEGDSGAVAVDFTVSLSVPFNEDVTFQYFTQPVAPTTAGVDYQSVSDSPVKTIPKGALQTTVTVFVNGDTDYEQDETFQVGLQNVTNANWNSAYGVGTITNDDTLAAIIVTQSGGSTDVVEGGTTDSFTVVLSDQPEADVDVSVSGDSQVSIVGLPSGILTFTPGTWNAPQTVTVAAVDDGAIEGDHSGTISLNSASTPGTPFDGLTATVVANVTDNDTSRAHLVGLWSGNYSIEVTGFGYTAVQSGTLTMNIVSVAADGSIEGSGPWSTTTMTGIVCFDEFGSTWTRDSGEEYLYGYANADGSQVSASASYTVPEGTQSWDWNVDVSGNTMTGTFVSSRTPNTITLTKQSAVSGDGGESPLEENVSLLQQEQLDSIVTEAITRWQSAGLDEKGLTALSQASVQVFSLPNSYLGLAYYDSIYIDQDAAGHGWFIDATPSVDEEFYAVRGDPALQAVDGTAADDGFDLLTVVAHEMGHVLGLDHSDVSGSLMDATLTIAERRLPSVLDVQAVDSTGGSSEMAAMRIEQGDAYAVFDPKSSQASIDVAPFFFFDPWHTDFNHASNVDSAFSSDGSAAPWGSVERFRIHARVDDLEASGSYAELPMVRVRDDELEFALWDDEETELPDDYSALLGAGWIGDQPDSQDWLEALDDTFADWQAAL